MKGARSPAATPDVTYVRAAAGESWHGFVAMDFGQGLAGLENLSLIPGTGRRRADPEHRRLRCRNQGSVPLPDRV